MQYMDRLLVYIQELPNLCTYVIYTMSSGCVLKKFIVQTSFLLSNMI